jgi:hypothetical protein
VVDTVLFPREGRVATCFWAVNRGLRLRGEGLQRSNTFKLKVNLALHKRLTRCHLGAGETCVKDDSQVFNGEGGWGRGVELLRVAYSALK